ncbi:BNR-4 repeat-containing protein [Desertivirga xinjiangensis]|uniref:BNR-4 repeat-containing protein n=1 Tax=Desertivirga xinjiangensis TaxID=539206 RepID=UPI002109035B|nr:BNR-4 repeat-containing protein [Pedobacter xinjiangensis]
MRKVFKVFVLTLFPLLVFSQTRRAQLLNSQDDGYRGIWYQIGPTGNEYAYKYSGGLGTYPSNHYPFSVYVKEKDKTFFCYGGTDSAGTTLYHQVGYYDHRSGMVSRPTIVMDKATGDAHDNPVIQVDKDGYIWLFSTSHGTGRPSFIHKSLKPFDISQFETVRATKQENGRTVAMDNFSYLQVYYHAERGFLGLFTSYENRKLRFGNKNTRNIAWMTSKDGIHWSDWKFIAKIEEGHYQTSGQWKNRVGTSFNYHPNLAEGEGLDHRTNIYYLYTDDNGQSWKAASGKSPDMPLTTISNEALVYDYAAEGLNVYINDLNFDRKGNPVILYETGKGYAPGVQNGLKQWNVAYWTGQKWRISRVTSSDHNYDMGSLYVAKDVWRIIAPTETGPQSYNAGGEIVMWESRDKGVTWTKQKQMTRNSLFNHSYPRRPVNADKGFYAFWADGNARERSASSLYFADSDGKVYRLPAKMDRDFMKPELVFSKP